MNAQASIPILSTTRPSPRPPRRTVERLKTPLLAHAIALALAVGIHTTPLVPGVAHWVGRIFERKVKTDRSETIVSVELDLSEDQEPEKKDPPPEKPPEPLVAPPELPQETAPTPEDFVVPKPAPTPVTPPIPAPTPAPKPTPTTPPEPPKPAGPVYKPEINDVGIAANPSGNPNNVVIIVVGKALRDHPVGARMGALLPGIGQWKDFFEGTGIDAVKDVELMVLQGPQLKVSDRVDTVLVFSKPMDEIEVAVKKIVERLGGTWLEGTAVPAATAKADKFDRLFMLDKSKRALYITHPPAPTGKDEKGNPITWDEAKLKEEIQAKVKKFSELPAPTTTPPFAIKMMVTDPGKFGRAPVVGDLIPRTMKRLVFQVDALSEGRAMLHIELWDKDEATAASNVDEANADWGKIQLGAMLKGLNIPNTTFKAEGSLVRGDLEVDKDFLDTIFELLAQQVTKEAKKR